MPAARSPALPRNGPGRPLRGDAERVRGQTLRGLQITVDEQAEVFLVADGHDRGQQLAGVNGTLKGQPDLEEHGGRIFEGVAVRVAQRLLAMTVVIWHNVLTGQPIARSLTPAST